MPAQTSFMADAARAALWSVALVFSAVAASCGPDMPLCLAVPMSSGHCALCAASGFAVLAGLVVEALRCMRLRTPAAAPAF